MDTRGKVEVTGADLRKAVCLAYDLSEPRGLGYLHFRPGALDDETVSELIAHGDKYRYGGLYMDYVHGRCCKFFIESDGAGKLYTRLNWFNHTVDQCKLLLRSLGLPDIEARMAMAEADLEEMAKEQENSRGARY